MRLQKFLAQCGVGSRRQCEVYIEQGRVSVNGQTIQTQGLIVDPGRDQVTFDGKGVSLLVGKHTFLFHKPPQVICTKKDTHGRKTVMDFFPDYPDVFPVGRLDYESEGLLLMTSDGDFALRATHPRYGVKKVYEVYGGGQWNPELALKAWTKGVEMEDGTGIFHHVEVMNLNHLRVTVSEGRKRFVRRMCLAQNFLVTRLVRTVLGPFVLGDLAPGAFIEIDPQMVQQMKATWDLAHHERS